MTGFHTQCITCYWSPRTPLRMSRNTGSKTGEQENFSATHRRDAMSFLGPTGIQDREDASLSDRLALWIVEQQQQHDFTVRTRPRIGILATMGYARYRAWPIHHGYAPTAT